MKKTIIMLLVVILWIEVGLAHSTQKATKTVVATSGLTLRKAPDGTSPVIKVIPYGDEVTLHDAQPDTTYLHRVGWVDGEWIVVRHEGDVGFIFDGYLTDLPLPSYEAEYSPYDLELIYPLETWMANHHILTDAPDTLLRSERSKVVHNYVNGNKMVQSNQHDYYKLEVYLHDVRLMDAYHLLRVMLDDPIANATYTQQSTFIEDSVGNITRIKIDIDDLVDIRKMGPDLVRIQMISVDQYCGL